MASSMMIVGHKSAGFYANPNSRSSHSKLSWNPISKLAFASEIGFLGKKTRVVQYCDNHKTKRNSFVVYASSLPGAPLPSGPPSKPMSWVLGLVVSLILPFFTNKWGPLWVLKNRIETAVETVEHIVEAVEKVAGEVDKIAEDIGDDLPQGKLRDLVELVEHTAEKTAKTADCLDNLIDKVQEAEDKVEGIVESIAKSSPKKAK
ncbi:hypothetical protein ACP275_03G108500 [Erythranthe tilingii]